MRTAIRLALAAICAGALAVGVIVLTLDARAKTAIERGVAEALGVDTHVRSVSVGFLGGRGRIEGLEVSNPPGFPSRNFLALRLAQADVTVSSLRAARVPVPAFTLDGVAISLESDGERANYRAILERLGGADARGSGKRFAVRELAIRDVSVHVAPGLIERDGSGAAPADLRIPEIVVRDVRGAGVRALTGIVLDAILGAVAQAAELPEGLRDGLQTGPAHPEAPPVARAPAPAPEATADPAPAAAEPRADEALSALFDDLPGVSLPGVPAQEAPPALAAKPAVGPSQ